MAWIFSVEAEDSPKLSKNGSVLSRTVKTTDTLKRCSCPAWPEANYAQPPFGMTCERCEGVTCLRWISSSEDFHAKMLALQALGAAWQESEAALSLKCSGSLASVDRNSYSWRTCQLSFFEDSTAFSWNSMRWGMMRDGRLFQPRKLEPRTSDRDGSYLPTPVTLDSGSRVNQSANPNAALRPTLGAMA